MRRTAWFDLRTDLNKSSAALAISSAWSVRWLNVICRVNVVKSGQRILSFMVEPASKFFRNWRATSEDCSRTVFSNTLSSRTSREKVISWLIDFVSRSVSIGRLSIPLAWRARSRPFSPNKRIISLSGHFAMSPMVWIPNSVNRADVFGPTPQSISAGSGLRNAASSPNGTIVTALGGFASPSAFNLFNARAFPTSVAIFARSLFDAIPMEHGSCNSLWMRACNLRATASGDSRMSLISRKASSMEICSTREVRSSSLSITCRETSP